ncbi:tRNA (adenosine(37)-N6)-threonylcarbamoyltransferase complex transferase subunit TsaD [Pyruvatibacter sp. HU-CL02332]
MTNHMDAHTPTAPQFTVLGIETSCDETAAAIVRGTPGQPGEILSNLVLSQFEEHAPYGGVVPEIAARAHIDHLDSLVASALREADVSLGDLDAIAATSGPGLVGGLMVGLVTGKSLAFAADKPFVAVNHLEAHALTARLVAATPFPYLVLLVSGGHSQLLEARGVGDYTLLGTTLDDAVGEAFDKTAKLMGLGYPGGPHVEKWALKGDPKRFDLPRPMKGRPGSDFSFAGLKTALRQTVTKLAPLTETDLADAAASFQAAAADTIEDRTRNAMRTMRDASDADGPIPFVVAGGVASNKMLRARLEDLATSEGFALTAPPLPLCTDNAAMIAWAGVERMAIGSTDGLDTGPRPRWPLADLTA